MDACREDVLAPINFPREHPPRIAGATPPERVSEKVERRSDVIGILPEDKAILRLLGALMIETEDERAVVRRDTGPEALGRIDYAGHVRSPAVAGLSASGLAEGRRF